MSYSTRPFHTHAFLLLCSLPLSDGVDCRANSEHYQQKAEDVLEEHQIRERDIQARVEKERREFEGQVLRKAEQLISEYKDAASKAASKAADEICENRAREMELMHQAEKGRTKKGTLNRLLNDTP